MNYKEEIKSYRNLLVNRLAVENKGKGRKLTIVYDGEFASNELYMKKKVELGKEVGIEVIIERLTDHDPDKISNPVIYQLPVDPVNKDYVEHCIQKLKPEYDADALGDDACVRLYSYTGGKMWRYGLYSSYVVPPTAASVIEILNLKYNPMNPSMKTDSLVGKNVLIIGRSKLIGLPLFSLLTGKGCTVTLAHSKTQNIDRLMATADIIITGVGQADFINESNCPRIRTDEKLIIIDAATIFKDGKLVGDLAKGDWVCQYTPVPGGVGQLTVPLLFRNVELLYRIYLDK